MREEFDYVLIDTPPLNQYDDAVVLGQFADGLVLVLEANATRREPALRVVENLRAAQVQVLGAVLNKRTSRFLKLCISGFRERQCGGTRVCISVLLLGSRGAV